MVERFREAAASVTRTVSRTFVVAGRSRRSEFGYYWIASTLVGGAARLSVGPHLGWPSSAMVPDAINLVVIVPFFALFARRLHDQGRSAWWALALPPLVAANIYDHLRVNFHAYDAAWPELSMWELILLIPAIGSVAVMFIPGDVGPNRYGHDPRLDEREPDTV
ncbi:MAG TPA: DUF805 domain-containing protein [Allosphingosinicella sp.]|jgi:uncharacterized membrane protein YhaH (DUF805 family)